MNKEISKIVILLAGLGLMFLGGCAASAPTVADRPIRFDRERAELTAAYLQDRYGIEQEGISIRPQMIVLHWTAIPELENSFEAFYPSRLPDTRPDITSAGALNVSAHYLVDRSGTIFRLMPDTVMARHVIGLNHTAIGIENVGGTPGTPLTKAQLQANAWLVRQLAGVHPIRYLIGHYEYTLFEGDALWMEKDSGYRTDKTDPGRDFMRQIRRQVRDLGLEGPPKNTNAP